MPPCTRTRASRAAGWSATAPSSVPAPVLPGLSIGAWTVLGGGSGRGRIARGRPHLRRRPGAARGDRGNHDASAAPDDRRHPTWRRRRLAAPGRGPARQLGARPAMRAWAFAVRPEALRKWEGCTATRMTLILATHGCVLPPAGARAGPRLRVPARSHGRSGGLRIRPPTAIPFSSAASPFSDRCTISGVNNVPAGCELNFGTRKVTFQRHLRRADNATLHRPGRADRRAGHTERQSRQQPARRYHPPDRDRRDHRQRQDRRLRQFGRPDAPAGRRHHRSQPAPASCAPAASRTARAATAPAAARSTSIAGTVVHASRHHRPHQRRRRRRREPARTGRDHHADRADRSTRPAAPTTAATSTCSPATTSPSSAPSTSAA